MIGRKTALTFKPRHNSDKQFELHKVLLFLGYGDSVSVLHVPTDWEGEDVVFRCVASVGDPSADQTAFLFLPLTGQCACVCVCV